MQSLIQTLRTSQDPIRVASCILGYIEVICRNSEAMNQEQTYSFIDKIARSLSKSTHPHQFILDNLIPRLKFLVQQAIKYEITATLKKPAPFKTQRTISELFENLQVQTEKKQAHEEEGDETKWIRKITLNCIDVFKSQVEGYASQLFKNIKPHLKQNQKVVLFLPPKAVLEMFESLKAELDFNCVIIKTSSCTSTSKVFSTVDIKNSSGVLKRASKVFICCNGVLRNGGAVSLSGGLLLAMSAIRMESSVVCLCPSFGFANRPVVQDGSLSYPDNPLQHLREGSSKYGSVTCLTKKYDQIGPEYISMVVSDQGISTPNHVYKLFDKYYE